MDVIVATEQFVQKEMKDNDVSHDWAHVNRVRNLAVRIAKEEKMSNLEQIELAALLHDVRDPKYSGDEDATVALSAEFLRSLNYPEEKLELVLAILRRVSYSSDLGSGEVSFPELAAVQDADRLDAIGAIGVVRCFSYGAFRGRPMFDLSEKKRTAPFATKDEYRKLSGKSSLSHFYDKLLYLKNEMRTKTGARLAQRRHETMLQFISEFEHEIS